ncbi:outer membrane lipoprotein chaperone LolA [Pontibacterium granulatum]|uniref:outer membrane lipoprotein chaperone LolA n=1 Tax=Pontibacterium granulatum TaxID=2036029 RepID=UPI00249CECDE|nr:outer membrane lipoprotein chaperone LolA [Pontibacterium granulatum]
MKKACLTAALVVSAAGTATFAQAETASEKLKALLDGYSTFSAEFSQIASADQGGRVQESTGSLQVAKPNKFRWTSNEPYPQIIVGDGTYIWVHDPDLEQVTRKPAQNGTTSAPALILNGQIEELEQQFNIAGGQVSDLGGQLFELIPLTEQNTFKRIRLFFAGEKISELMLEDTLGQRTTIVFQNQQINPEFSANQFQFVLPEGADLILDSEI